MKGKRALKVISIVLSIMLILGIAVKVINTKQSERLEISENLTSNNNASYNFEDYTRMVC